VDIFSDKILFLITNWQADQETKKELMAGRKEF